jgi:hypothetical protein
MATLYTLESGNFDINSLAGYLRRIPIEIASLKNILHAKWISICSLLKEIFIFKPIMD